MTSWVWLEDAVGVLFRSRLFLLCFVLPNPVPLLRTAVLLDFSLHLHPSVGYNLSAR
jgi:hypothetical protein